MLGPVRAAAGCCGGGGGGGGGDVSVENPGSRSSSDNCRMVANAVCARMNEIQRGGKQITKLQIYIYINIYICKGRRKKLLKPTYTCLVFGAENTTTYPFARVLLKVGTILRPPHQETPRAGVSSSAVVKTCTTAVTPWSLHQRRAFIWWREEGVILLRVYLHTRYTITNVSPAQTTDIPS